MTCKNLSSDAILEEVEKLRRLVTGMLTGDRDDGNVMRFDKALEDLRKAVRRVFDIKADPKDPTLLSGVADAKEVKESLTKVNRLMEGIYESLDEVVFVVDPKNRRIVSCNHAVEDVFGYNREEMIGKKIAFLHLDVDMYHEFARRVFSDLDSVGSFKGEFQMKRKDGTVFFTITR